MENDPAVAHGVSPPMSPLDEIEHVDLQVEHAGIDEWLAMFDPQTQPKLPHPKEEAVTDLDGVRTVDVMADTPSLDPLGTFDLSASELRDLDVK